LLIVAPWRTFPRMAKQRKRPQLTHSKVTFTTHPNAPWRVTYDAEHGGRRTRLRKSFASEDKAWTFAEDRDREISNHGVRYGDIPPELRRAFDFYRDESADLIANGAEVPRFEDLISRSLAEIRAQLQLASDADLPLAEAVVEFLAYKKTRVKERQLANLTDQLKRFTTDYGDKPISTVTTAQVEKWLSSLRSRRNPDKLKQAPFLSPLSRNHYRATLHGFFEYASAPSRGWCKRNPVADLEPEIVKTGEPEAYSPEDAARIMQVALDHKPALVPVLALGMFAGLRVSEAIEIDLAKLKSDEDEFRATGKTGPRMAPFTDSCKAWIFAQDVRKGKAWTQSPRTLVNEMQSLFTLAQVDQIDNGARHSFISYRCAEGKDTSRVADECGNSVGTIKAHYRQLVTAAAAAKYFAIRPEAAAENVTGIEAGRASA
jgi:site-specific recombinase XerD